MINAELTKQIEILKREIAFIGREVQRIECANSEGLESVDEIGRAVQVAQSAMFDIELRLDGTPSSEDELMVA